MSIRIQEPQEISDMSLRVPGRRIAWSLTIMAIGALSALPALADEIVYFVNGKAMMVKKVEKGPEFTILEIEGGGRIGVPNDHITRIELYQVSAPRPAVSTARSTAAAGGATRQRASTPSQPGSVAQTPDRGRMPEALNSRVPAAARPTAARGLPGGQVVPPRAGPGGRFTQPQRPKYGYGGNRSLSRGKGGNLRGARRPGANRRSVTGRQNPRNPRSRPAGAAARKPPQTGAATKDAGQQTTPAPASDGSSSEEN
jgi:hypothetical protein